MKLINNNEKFFKGKSTYIFNYINRLGKNKIYEKY
jgi:hypothetical protein